MPYALSEELKRCWEHRVIEVTFENFSRELGIDHSFGYFMYKQVLHIFYSQGHTSVRYGYTQSLVDARFFSSFSCFSRNDFRFEKKRQYLCNWVFLQKSHERVNSMWISGSKPPIGMWRKPFDLSAEARRSPRGIYNALWVDSTGSFMEVTLLENIRNSNQRSQGRGHLKFFTNFDLKVKKSFHLILFTEYSIFIPKTRLPTPIGLDIEKKDQQFQRR